MEIDKIMSKKTLNQQKKKLFAAALFAMLCVGIYAHVESWAIKQEAQSQVLGSEDVSKY